LINRREVKGLPQNVGYAIDAWFYLLTPKQVGIVNFSEILTKTPEETKMTDSLQLLVHSLSYRSGGGGEGGGLFSEAMDH